MNFLTAAALAWLVVSVPATVAVGRWLRGLDCCPHADAGPDL